MKQRLHTYKAYSIGCAIVWAAILSAIDAVEGAGAGRRVQKGAVTDCQAVASPGRWAAQRYAGISVYRASLQSTKQRLGVVASRQASLLIAYIV